jgi:hypothetical protein
MPKRKDGMSRAEISARHALDRQLAKSIRDVRRGTKWQSIQGGLYRQNAGWFVSLTPSVHMKPGISSVSIHAKPMAIDLIFWEIFSPSTADAPLSYRFSGAWVCNPPEFATCSVSETEGADAMAATILEIADLKLAEIVDTMTLEKFLQRCLEKNGDTGSYQASVICTLIAMHRHTEALQVAQHGQSLGHGGGFIRARGFETFNDLAVSWLTSTAGPRH